MSFLLDTQNLNVLQKTMDCLWTRQRVISDNIANVDTPNYKSKTVSFEDVMAEILTGDSEKAASELQTMQPTISEDPNAVIRDDGNSVDIDKENIELVRFTYQYQAAARQVSDYLDRMKYAINGG